MTQVTPAFGRFSLALSALLPLLACGVESPLDQQKAGFDTVAARPGWLYPADACPADVMEVTAGQTIEGTLLADECLPRLQSCLDRCREEDASHCFGAALAFQKLGEALVSDALFLKACRLGEVSGCTNRAASLSTGEATEEEGLRCAARTFEKTCEAGDAWGCTMLGLHLAEGMGVEKDLERALEVLPVACEADETDPACVGARQLLSQIEKARALP